MGKLRRAIASFSMVAILSTLFVTNVASAHWSDVYFDATEREGVTSATADRNHNDEISRAEVFRMLVDALGQPAPADAPCDFPDCGDAWYSKYIAAANAAGIMNGNKDGMAMPKANINRHDAAVTLYNVMNGSATLKGADLYSDVKAGAYYEDAVAWAYENDIATGYGDGTFGVGRNVTRGEFARMLAVAFAYEVTDVTPDPDPNNPDVPVVEAGDIMVSLSDMSPDVVELPKNATGVTVAAWDFEGKGMLKSLQINKVGVSDLAGDHQVYLYDSMGQRLTGGKTVNSTTQVATFNNLNMVIDGKTTLYLRLDVGATLLTGTAGFEIESMDSVMAGESMIKGSFPATADMFGLSTITVGTATITKNGTVTDAAVGEKEATIAKFKVATSTNDGIVEELGLYVTGTVSSEDVQNFKLYAAGEDEAIAMADMVNNRDVVMFDLEEDYEIAKGDNRSFWVEADFSTGRTDDTLLVYVDETTDVLVRDDKYGYGMKVDASLYDGSTCTTGTPTECNAMTLQGGDVTISGITVDNRDIATNEEDAEVLRFTMTAEAEVTVDDFTIYLDTDAAGEGLLAADGTANYTDIKISEVDGDHVWGPIDADVLKTTEDGAIVITDAGTDLANAHYKFTDDLYLEAGESKEFVMTLDVDSSALLDEDTLVAAIYIDQDDPRLKDTNNKVLTNSGTLVPTSSYIGDTFAVDSASLTVAKSNEVSSDSTMVIGSENVGLLSLAMGASDSNDVIITEVNFTGYIDDGGATNLFVAGSDTVKFNEVVQSMKLYHTDMSEDNRVKGPNGQTITASATDAGLISFDNIRWTVPAGETMELILAGNINNNSAYNADQFKIDIADVSEDITAENEDGNSVTSTSADTPNGGTADDVAAYTQHTVSSGGNLSIDVPSTTAVSDIIVAGTQDNEVATLRVTAAQEAFKVTKISLRNQRPDYDDNVEQVKVRYYSDAAQTVEKTTTCSNNGSTVWTCSGMDMRVPNPDVVGNPNYAEVDVLVSTKTISANGDAADAGDRITFTFTPAGDFESRAVSSPAQIEEEEIYVTDIGATSTFADAGSYTAGVDADGGATISATVVLTDNNTNFPTGTVVCSDVDSDGCDAADEKMYVIAACTAADVPHGDCTADKEIVVRRAIFNTTAAAIPDDGDLDYINPTSVLNTKEQSLYGTKLAFEALTPSHGGQNTTEEVMKFSMTAAGNGDAKFRQGDVNNATTAATDFNTAAFSGIFTATDALSTVATGGIGATAAFQRETSGGIDGASIIYTLDAAADLSSYSGMCYAVRASEAANTITATFDDDAGTDQTIASGTLVAGEWKQVCGDFDGTATNYDVVSTITFAVTDDSAVNAATYDIDNIVLFKEKLTVDLSLNANVTAGNYTSYLKRGNQIVATGYAVWSPTSDTGNIQFVPVSPYGEFTVEGTQTYTVETDTTLFTDSTNTENLTTNIDLGGYQTSTGDVVWYDDEGEVTVTFAGVSVTDKISNTLGY